VEGDDHVLLYGGSDVLLREIGELVEQTIDRDRALEDRFLTTALAARFLGDPDAQALEAVLRRFAATGVAIEGELVRACFDGPGRALRCAAALCEGGDACAVHISEVVRGGAGVRGPALDAAAVIAGRTAAGELRVSRLVVELVGDAEHAFVADGEIEAIAVYRVRPAPGAV
jgi:hypothetical protein